MEWKLKHFNELNTQELYTILQERVAVFVVEQNCPYPEVDGHDKVCYHLFCEWNGEMAAYLRILPKNTSYPEASFGRVLVKEKFRGQGLAKELVGKAISFMATELGEQKIMIGAQEYLQEFYSSFGFKAVSEVYLEDNIPHVDMLFEGA